MITGIKKRPVLFSLYHTLWHGLDWVFPPECVGCNRIGWRFCPDCLDTVQLINYPHCPICLREQAEGKICAECQQTPPPYSELRSWGIYRGNLRAAILRMKYKRDIGLSEFLSRFLREIYEESGWKVDIIVPTPLSRARQSKRGYNQVNLMGYPFAWYFQLPYIPQALIRTRDTLSQVGLSARERKENVKNAFVANNDFVNQKIVLLIDDVATTCSTLIAASKALKDAGANVVYCLTLARAIRISDDDRTDSPPG